jgi:hypothetical protein
MCVKCVVTVPKSGNLVNHQNIDSKSWVVFDVHFERLVVHRCTIFFEFSHHGVVSCLPDNDNQRVPGGDGSNRCTDLLQKNAHVIIKDVCSKEGNHRGMTGGATGGMAITAGGQCGRRAGGRTEGWWSCGAGGMQMMSGKGLGRAAAAGGWGGMEGRTGRGGNPGGGRH